MESGLITELLREREKFYDRVFLQNESISIILRLFLISIPLFALYGFVMGIYNSALQGFFSAIKVPVLFLLSLLICYPAMFIFNIFLGSKLNLAQSLGMILSAYAITSCILASFAPIVLFFMLIGSSYAFLRLLHVVIFSVAGLTGMATLSTGLKYACEKHSIYPKQGMQVFKIWVLIFAFVGTQLAWNLRPFLGNKELPFQLFRKQESNFYSHILHTTGEFLFSSGQKPKRDLRRTSDIKKDANLMPDSTIMMGPIKFLPKQNITEQQNNG